MKLRTKFFLFFSIFLLLIASGISFYAENIVGDIFKQQAVSNLRIIAEQSESAYLSFLGTMKVRVIDWTSDAALRGAAKAVLNAPKDSAERDQLAKEFGKYVSEKKMPFDETIFLTDLLDKDGIVIASTQHTRVGRNEKEEHTEYGKVHNVDATMNSKFGEAFFGTIILDGDEEHGHPHSTSLSVSVRLFEPMSGGVREPLDMILLVYYSNVAQIAEVLGSGTSVYAGLPTTAGRLTQRALLNEYETSDLYLVNNERLMVTPPRTVTDVRVRQKVDTLPVRECLENGKEINKEYDNYQGIRVIGASMCFQKEGVVVLAEIQKAEIFAPLTALVRSTTVGSAVLLLFGMFIISIFLRRPLSHINDVVMVAKQVANGQLNTQVEVHTKDEIGYLASSFNMMIRAIRRVQRELRISKHKVEEEKAKDEALLANLGEGLVAVDRSGDIIVINRVAEKMLGLRSKNVIGKRAVDLWDALDENGIKIQDEQRPLLKVTDKTTSASVEMVYRRKNDGYSFPVAVTVTPIILEGKNLGTIDIFRDISKEKDLEQTRRDLLSLASHQLRTPLSGTKWLIETLKKGLHGPLTSKQIEYLDEIYKINQKMTTLVQDMLGVLRMEGDTTLGKKEAVSVSTVLDSVFETLDGAAKSKNITLFFPKKVDYILETNSTVLQTILEGIISNAINYSQDGKSVEVSVEKNPAEVIFVIKDYGIGIPENERMRLFERFYRASNAKIFDTKGTGLGLYIVDILAKKIGAHVLFDSELGKGSRFYVHIPYFETKQGMPKINQ